MNGRLSKVMRHADGKSDMQLRKHMQSFSVGLCVALALFPFASSAQQTPGTIPSASPSTDANLYVGEGMVIQRISYVYSMNADGTGYQERTVVAKLQTDAAVQQLGVISLQFASASEHVEFKYVRVRRPDGSVTETPLTDVIEQPEKVTVEAPFYSDLKESQLPVKGLRVGDTLEWQARLVKTKAEAPGQFWGQQSFVDDAVILKETLDLRVPAGAVVNVWTNPKLGSKPVESTEGGQHVYRWEHANLKPTAKNSDTEAKSKKILTPDEIVDADQGKLPAVAWTTFKSWEAVGAWYRGLEGDREMPDDTIKTKVAELTAGKTTEEEKVRAVYSAVSSQIRYIGVAFGVGRYQPHRADVVLENQYGDCKDKHTLLASMLIALGLHPDAVLIGAGVRFNESVPAPSAFNHLITRVQVDGKEVWLDATAEVAPYRMLSEIIRDKQALVVPDTGTATIERSPKDPPFASVQEWTAKGTLNDKGVSDSQIALSLRGDAELVIRQVLRQVSPAQYDEFTKRLIQGLGYQGTTSHSVVGRPDATDDPLKMSFDYHREQGGDWENYRVLPQLAPVTLPMVNEKEPPTAPINLDTPRTEESKAEMKLPDGWGAELPEAVHEKTAFATYDMTYKFEKGVLYTERKVVVLQAKVPAEDWKAYKKWQDAVGLGLENYVQLTRKGVRAPTSGKDKAAAGSPATSESNPEAEKLITQAGQAIQKLDSDKARKLLDQAAGINPNQIYLQAAYGALAMAMGMQNEAFKDFHRELALHPDALKVYPLMLSIQLREGNESHPAAEQTLRQWIAADSTNPAPAGELMELLSADRKYDEAYAVSQAALKQLSADDLKKEGIQMYIGQSEVRTGHGDVGGPRLVALLKTTDDPLMLNNAAYALADANLELPLAESSARAALDKLTKETESWTLDESPNTLKQKSSLLSASWDTLGWILFRAGKLAEAESYVNAAWLNGLRDEVGEHLVEIRAAIARPSDAAKLEKMPTPSKMKSPDPHKSQQQLRTVPLGPASGLNGAAGYRILIAHGAVEKAEATDRKAMDGGVEKLEKVNLPGYTPQGSDAKLVRELMLNCFSGGCEIVFMPN
jgi:tetratricopeptide (TPR) repeat protein